MVKSTHGRQSHPQEHKIVRSWIPEFKSNSMTPSKFPNLSVPHLTHMENEDSDRQHGLHKLL